MDTYLEMVQNAENQGKLTGLDTGFHELNRRTGGLRGGELIIVGARPAMGKSSFVLNIAEHVAIETKKTVALFNLEMSKSDMVTRILCSEALVDSHKLQTGDLTPDDWERIGGVIDVVANSPFYLDDTATIKVSEIRAKCRRLKQSKDLALVVIDYLQLMSDSNAESRQHEISKISRSLKILAKELNVPVIALSQLARSSESGTDKRPMLSHLRESGSIEQDADMVMFLYRDEYYNPDTEEKDIAECIIAKNRRGETGKFKLGWQGKYTKFLNIEYREKEES
jgi:replicative DNA helicase